VTVQSSEVLDPTTASSCKMHLLNSPGTTAAASSGYSGSIYTENLTPSTAYSNSSTQTILVQSGSPGAVIKDSADDDLAANLSRTFTDQAQLMENAESAESRKEEAVG
jgi:hypothetical protein